MRGRFLAGLLTLLTLMAAIPATAATIVTYQFTVTATEGPLNGVSSTGQFSYDASELLLPGTFYGSGQFESFSFNWNGLLFTEATVDTGLLTFDSYGGVVGAEFGTRCFETACSLSQVGDWMVHIDYANSISRFNERWAIPSGGDPQCGGSGSTNTDDCSGIVSGFQQVTNGGGNGSVPEPATFALLGVGLAGLAATRRRTLKRQQSR